MNPKREKDGRPSNIRAVGLEKSGGKSLGSGGRLDVGRKGEEGSRKLGRLLVWASLG